MAVLDYFTLSVTFACVMFTVQAYVQRRQHRLYHEKKLPKDLAEFTSEPDFAKSQLYRKDLSSFKFVKMSVDLVTTLGFYFAVAAFYRHSKELAAALWSPGGNAQINAVWVAVVFSAQLVLVSDLIDLPFALYKTFVLEEKHGFNKTTAGVFFGDFVKLLLLKLTIGLAVLAATFLVLDLAGKNFPLYLWAFLFAIKIAAITLYPVLIQPCFNTVAELPAGDVRSAVERLAASVSYPLKKLYSVDGSKRSTHSNAYLYGFCGSKRIVLYDTLLAQCTPQQIVAVLAHELGHWHHSHVLVGLGLNELVTVITFYVMRFFLYSGELYDAFGMAERPLFIGAMLFFFVYDPISQVQMLVANALMRRFENQADDYALRLGYGEDLVEGLKTLQSENKTELLVDPLYALYHYNHPPIPERIRRMRRKQK